MKKSIAFLLTCSVIIVTSCSTPQRASGWEYKSLQTYTSQNLDQKLNDLAKDGWIVVSSSTSQGSSPYAVVILKRPRQ